jgi:hypothetical protein
MGMALAGHEPSQLTLHQHHDVPIVLVVSASHKGQELFSVAIGKLTRERSDPVPDIVPHALSTMILSHLQHLSHSYWSVSQV